MHHGFQKPRNIFPLSSINRFKYGSRRITNQLKDEDHQIGRYKLFDKAQDIDNPESSGHR